MEQCPQIYFYLFSELYSNDRTKLKYLLSNESNQSKISMSYYLFFLNNLVSFFLILISSTYGLLGISMKMFGHFYVYLVMFAHTNLKSYTQSV